MRLSNDGSNLSTTMGDLELVTIAGDDNLIMEDSTLDLGSMINDLNLAPIPWSDPMFYLSITILVAFIIQIIYNLYTRDDQH
jgi:hypothetical protein